jgi:SMODS domain-containing protein
VGSWGKGTQVRPPRDSDVLFILPDNDFYRFEQRAGNRQSQLLQEVKEVLVDKYPTTRMRGDGQIVVVAFNTYQIEVVPAFKRLGGGYFICDTADKPSGKCPFRNGQKGAVGSRSHRWLRAPERRVARSQVDRDFTAAKAELIRLRVAEKKRELIRLEYMRAVEDKAIGVVLQALSGMAARCAGNDLQLRRKLIRLSTKPARSWRLFSTNSPMKLMSRPLRGGLLDLIEVQLKCIGGGPALDFQDAGKFLARFHPAIDAALRRRLQ